MNEFSVDYMYTSVVVRKGDTLLVKYSLDTRVRYSTYFDCRINKVILAR
jgi:hypothetical protein